VEVKPRHRLTEVEVVPPEWERRGLLSVVSVANGQVDPTKEPFRSMTLVAPDHIEPGTGRLLEKRTAGEQRAISGKYVVGVGDVVYSKIRPYLKKAILADFDGLCSADMYPMCPAEGVVGSYVLAVLLAHAFTAYAESVSVRSGMPKINREELAGFELDLPPLPEQRAIAAALNDVDALLDGLDRLIAKKRDLKQAAMQQLLAGRTRLPGFDGEWHAETIGNLAVKVGSGVTPTGGQRVYRSSGRPFMRSQNVGWGSLLLEEVAFIDEVTHSTFPDTEILSGDVFLNITGASIGRSAVADASLVGGNVNQHVCIIRADERRLAPAFLNMFLLSVGGQLQIDSFQSGGNRQGLNFSQVRSISVLLPPTVEEQAAIGVALSDMDADLAALESRRDKTRALKQGMMQELLTGKTRLV